MITSTGPSPLTLYADLVRRGRDGGTIDLDELADVLRRIGRSHEAFVKDLFAERPAMVQSGDPCPVAGCGGRLACYASRPMGRLQERRLCCNTCGGGKQTVVVPADQVRRRR